jgi:RNA polymerase sigma-70 factor (ECF subfamily)
MEDEKDPNQNWKRMVGRIMSGDARGQAELYKYFSRGIRFFIMHQVRNPDDVDDEVHRIFLIVVEQILKGKVREPDRLPAYAHAVAKNQLNRYIRGLVQDRRNDTAIDISTVASEATRDPERLAIDEQEARIARRIYMSIKKRPREVLMRFYLGEQTREQICREMDLSFTQFRLIKSRTKALFVKLGKARFVQRHGFRQP